jgi:hypothetical protein
MLTNPKPLGHATGEKLSSTNVDAAFAQLPYAIDGNAGGAYTPSAPITIGGVDVGEAIASRVCRVTVNGSGLASGAQFGITSSLNDAGYTIDTGADTITVPTTGIYLYTWSMVLENDQTDNPHLVSASVAVNSVAASAISGYRFSASAAAAFVVVGAGVVEVTNLAHLVTLLVTSTGTTTVVGDAKFTLVRVAQ